MIGLGCMRLSTDPARDEARGVAVIRAALDAGIRFLDTSDAYALDEEDVGHNERLIAKALAGWPGERSLVRVATKGGLRRPGGRWQPDGRATHLREACEASLRSLDVAAIDLYQLHAVDPRTPLETSVRALAAMQAEGLIRQIGLCNVTVAQIEAARRHAGIASVQVSLGILDMESLRNGVAGYCREHGIELIAYRPFGGDRSHRLNVDPLLSEIAARYGATTHEVVLAWINSLTDGLIVLPGASSVAHANSIGNAARLELTAEDRSRIDERFPASRLIRIPRTGRRPKRPAGDVVIVMGMPGSGKSTVAGELLAEGYERLNRDERGGRLSGLIDALDAGLSSGGRQWVLDNTYPSRADRNDVIECAWRHGAGVRCILVDTPLAEAQINAVDRLLEAHGRLPMPEELRTIGRSDPRFFGPDAQFRWERQVELPTEDEGFEEVVRRSFVRRRPAGYRSRAVLLEFDGILCRSRSGAAAVLDPDDVVIPDGMQAQLERYAGGGWTLLSIAWRPQIAAATVDEADVVAVFERVRQSLGLAIDFAWCPHPAGPPVCWCRKPLPGLVLQLARQRGADIERSVLVGTSAADRTLAERLGMRITDVEAFVSDTIRIES